jgi:hypothetical protein
VRPLYVARVLSDHAHVRILLWLAASVLVLACSACGSPDGTQGLDVVEGTRVSVPRLVVEIHFPLIPAPGLSQDQYQFPWIMEIEDRVAALELETDGAEMYDVSEGLGLDEYLYFLTGPDRAAVLSAAKKIATGPGAPSGAFVVVNDSDGDMGEGQRLALSEIA